MNPPEDDIISQAAFPSNILANRLNIPAQQLLEPERHYRSRANHTLESWTTIFDSFKNTDYLKELHCR